MTFSIGLPEDGSPFDTFSFNAPAPAVDAIARQPRRVQGLLENVARAIATSSATDEPVDLIVQVLPSGDYEVVSSGEGVGEEDDEDLQSALTEDT